MIPIMFSLMLPKVKSELRKEKKIELMTQDTLSNKIYCTVLNWL